MKKLQLLFLLVCHIGSRKHSRMGEFKGRNGAMTFDRIRAIGCLGEGVQNAFIQMIGMRTVCGGMDHALGNSDNGSAAFGSEFIEAFWPGPLTLVMPRVEFRVIPEVTAGRDTIAVRQPDNEIARALLGECDEPVAAPSANVSGHPSPTTGQDVIEEMNGKVDIILIGEDCPVGIESTILLIKEDHPILLRKGAITKEQLQEVIPKKILELEVPPQDSL